MKFRASPLASALALACFVLLCAHEARARQTCPQVSVECPDTFQEGEELSFRVVLADADPSLTPTYEWTVSGGTITDGQGTAEIKVDRTGFAGQAISATVVVVGLPEGCESTESCTILTEHAPVARLVDSYGKVESEDEQARLDAFSDALRNEPGTQGYVMVYAGRRAHAGEAAKRGERAKNYLVGERGLEAERLVTVDGGFRDEQGVELFIVPVGASPPDPSPTLDPGEVEIIREEKPKPARKPATPATKPSVTKPKP